MDPLPLRVAARFLMATSEMLFHNVQEIEKAYPYAAGWQFSGPVDRFFKKYPGVRIEVRTIAAERWVAIVHGDGWTVEGGQATSESNAIRQAIQATVKSKKK